MGEKFTAKTVVEFRAAEHRVWDGLTRPNLIQRYLHGANVQCDWKVGSPIRYWGIYEGEKFEDKGTILGVETNKFLQMTLWSSMSGLPDEEENYTKITYTLGAANGVTTLTVIQDNLPSDKMRIYAEQNWKIMLNKLAMILSRRRS